MSCEAPRPAEEEPVLPAAAVASAATWAAAVSSVPVACSRSVDPPSIGRGVGCQIIAPHSSALLLHGSTANGAAAGAAALALGDFLQVAPLNGAGRGGELTHRLGDLLHRSLVAGEVIRDLLRQFLCQTSPSHDAICNFCQLREAR